MQLFQQGGKRWLAGMLSALIVLAGCESTGRSSVAVGPSVGPGSSQPLGSQKKTYSYNSDIFLDVAIPVFDPGIPTDQDELIDEGIWPQLRRAEANRFALLTKESLADTGVFGAVTVAPSPEVTADLYVIGKIEESDAEDVEISIELVDIRGRRWDKETFKHRVSEGFYRDKRNQNRDPYEPIFDDIADHIVQLLQRRSEAEKQEIKTIADMRFAQSLSPEAFTEHLRINRQGYYELTSLPAENDPMLKRVAPIRVQDQLFLDRMQGEYQAFDAEIDESYRTWQEETLPVVIAARKNRTAAVTRGILGAVLVGVAVANSDSRSTSSAIANVGAGIGGALLIKSALDKNAEAKVHSATIDELGESLDIEVDPQVVELEDTTLELTGTAQEQYLQWKSHLKRIYDLEATPDTQL